MSCPFTAAWANTRREGGGRLIAVLEQGQESFWDGEGGWSPGGKRRRLGGDLFAVLNTKWGVERRWSQTSWRYTGTGQEARDTTAVRKFQLDANFFSSGSWCHLEWISDTWDEVTSKKCWKYCLPKTSLKPFKNSLEKQNQAYSFHLLGFYSGRKKSLLRMKGMFIPKVTHWSMPFSWNYSLARPGSRPGLKTSFIWTAWQGQDLWAPKLREMWKSSFSFPNTLAHSHTLQCTHLYHTLDVCIPPWVHPGRRKCPRKVCIKARLLAFFKTVIFHRDQMSLMYSLVDPTH